MARSTVKTTIGALAFGLWVPVAQAATVVEDLNFSAASSLFGSGPSGELTLGPDSFGVPGLAEVHYEASLNTGTVDARVVTRLEATHPDEISFAAAAATPVDLALQRFPLVLPDPFPNLQGPFGIGSFETEFGVEADVTVEVFGRADLNLLNIDRRLETSATSLQFTTNPLGVVPNEPFNDSIDAEDETRIARAGSIRRIPLTNIRFGARATVFVTQESELSFGNLIGTVRATHDSGTVVTESFALDRADAVLLDLQKTGDWMLDLIGITVEADFSSEFGLRLGGRVCVVFCGRISSGILPFGSASFDLDFSERTIALGTLTVLPETQIVPLPAGLPLLLSGFCALGLLRRKRRAGA